MRLFFIVLAVCVGLVYLVGSGIGIEPKDRRPGTRLAGNLVPLPETWPEIELADEVHIETYPWYGIPFSVTTVIAQSGDALYVPSKYDQPAAFPGSKFWNRVVQANPNVRLRVGETLYELRIDNVTDEDEFLDGVDALAQRYGYWEQQLDELPEASQRAFTMLRLARR